MRRDWELISEILTSIKEGNLKEYLCDIEKHKKFDVINHLGYLVSRQCISGVNFYDNEVIGIEKDVVVTPEYEEFAELITDKNKLRKLVLALKVGKVNHEIEDVKCFLKSLQPFPKRKEFNIEK